MGKETRSQRYLRSLGLAGLILLALAGTGCVSLGPFRGQVLDAQTGQPVPGAIVLGVWRKGGGIPGLGYTALAGYREVEVDDQGRFLLERPDVSADQVSVTVYKAGYIAWNNRYVFLALKRREDVRVPSQILLERFPPGGSHAKHWDFISDASTRVGVSSLAPKFWNAVLGGERKQ